MEIKLDNLFAELKDIFPKLCLDKVLLVIRVIIISIWIIALWKSNDIKLETQIAFVAIIFISDALDGIFSRRFTLPKQQYWFRIFDATVDKLGIIFFLGTLFYLKRIDISLLLIIIGYNVLLVICPLIYIFGKSIKRVDCIQATIWSRFYAVSVGLFAFGAASSKVALQYRSLWAFYFTTIGIVSFFSHIYKVKKIKGENINYGYLR